MAIRILTSAITVADVRSAASGDPEVLDRLVRAVLHDVYGIALRFLWTPADAEEATQEIAIRVVTGLSTFDGRSSFRTWVYRIACNTLSTIAAKRIESAGISFESMSDELREEAVGRDDGISGSPFDAALVEEVKVGCTHAMLICLDRGHRLAYILGTILDIDHVEAAGALDITPAAFRKRLSRANRSIEEFMLSNCGLADSKNSCRCEDRVPAAIALGRVDPTALKFSKSPIDREAHARISLTIQQLEATRRAAEIYRSHPDFDHSQSVTTKWLMHLLSPFAAGGDPVNGRPASAL